MRVRAGHEAILHLRVTDDDGNIVASEDEVDIVVEDGAGTQVAAGSNVEGDEGVYDFTLPPHDTLDRLKATWTWGDNSRVDHIDVVGSRLVDLWQLRERHGLSNAKGEDLLELLEDAEITFRDVVGFPVVPEGARLRFAPPTSCQRLLLPGILFPIQLFSVTRDGAEIDIEKLRFGYGWLERIDGSALADGFYDVHLSHGLASPDADLVREAGVYIVYKSRKPDAKIPERATRVVTDGADYLLSQPDGDHPTGLPSVDAVLVRRRAEMPV